MKDLVVQGSITTLLPTLRGKEEDQFPVLSWLPWHREEADLETTVAFKFLSELSDLERGPSSSVVRLHVCTQTNSHSPLLSPLPHPHSVQKRSRPLKGVSICIGVVKCRLSTL